MERALLVVLWVLSVTMLTWEEFAQVALVALAVAMVLVWARRVRVTAGKQLVRRQP